MPTRTRLTLCSRKHCPPCDDMIVGLRPLQARFNFDIDVVDVDGDAVLTSRYGEEVPVLALRARASFAGIAWTAG